MALTYLKVSNQSRFTFLSNSLELLLVVGKEEESLRVNKTLESIRKSLLSLSAKFRNEE
jgi:hypothetical protein